MGKRKGKLVQGGESCPGALTREFLLEPSTTIM
jgi:hypothetical protein